ncbi:MAG TPA: hypothetical protein VIH79_05010, partial [Candidatus Nanopelagicaceae bacterium]
ADHLGVEIKQSVVLEDSRTGIDAGLASGAIVIGIPHLISYPPHPRLHLLPNLVGVSVRNIREIFHGLKENEEESLEVK